MVKCILYVHMSEALTLSSQTDRHPCTQWLKSFVAIVEEYQGKLNI